MPPQNWDSLPIEFYRFQIVVDGRLVDSSDGQTYHNVNPSSLEPNHEVPVSTSDDVDRAVAAAKKAAPSWAKVPWDERKGRLLEFANALEAHTEAFSRMLVKENGKPLFWAQNEVQSCVKWVRGICDLSVPDKIIEHTEERHVVERYIPLGVAVGIVPWNFPLMLTFFKLPAAILTGNTFILKPSPSTPYCCLKIGELGLRFFPPGVLQVLSGNDNLGPWLVDHPGVDRVAFTGSISTGKKILERCAGGLKKVTLEMGGNDPAIVCADVDLPSIIPKIAMIAFVNTGQLCMAIKRVYIHESIYEAALPAMVEFVETNMKIGDGFEENTFLGPISHAFQFERVKDFLAGIKKDKLVVATGSLKPLDRTGMFISPIVLDNPPEDSSPVVDEPFGPILPLLKWSDEDDVIRRANDTHYGLGGSVWSNDTAQAERISKQLKAGTIWVNTHGELEPNVAFGCHKSSGYGVECGVEGLKSYCQVQSVFTRPGK